MKKLAFLSLAFLFALLPSVALAAAKNPTEESSSENEKPSQSPLKGIASGVKNVAYDGPKDFTEETVKAVPKKPPIVNVVEGVNRGTEKLLDHTIKGAYKVVTLGTDELESYEIQEPEKGSNEPTKIKISLPGT